MSFVEGNLSLGIELAPGTLERLQNQLKSLEKGATVRVKLDANPINQGTNAINRLDQAAQKASSSISTRLGGALRGAGQAVGALAAVGGAGLIALGTKAIMAGKEFNILQQQVRAGLTAILGTTKAAEGLLTQVNKLNDTSPFPRSSFLSATQQLVGFGVSAQKVVPILDAVQNAVAGIGGDSNDIQMFTRAFAQIQSQGRLTGDVLFTLGERGIDAAQIIGQQMGKTGQTIKAEVTAGTLGADKAIDALTKGLSKKFDGAVENVAKSFVGASDRVTARLRDIGAVITSVFINPMGGGAAVDGLNNIANGLANIRDNVVKPLIPLMRQLADIFVRATQEFARFTSGIKTDQVLEFVNTLKTLLPVIVTVGAKLVASLTSSLPVIGKLTGALGGPATAIALVIATVPELRQAFTNLVSAVRPLVEALLPAFQDALQVLQGAFSALVPVLSTAVNIIGRIAAILTPVVNLLQNMGLLGPVFALIIARFGLMKLGVMGFSTATKIAFGEVRAAAAMMAADLKLAATMGTPIKGRLDAVKDAAGGAKMAVGGMGSALASLVSPANLAALAIGVIISKFAQAKQAGKEMAAEVTKGLNLGNLKDQPIALDAINNKIAELQGKIDKGLDIGTALRKNDGGIGGFIDNLINQRTEVDKNKTAVADLRTQLNDLQQIKNVQVGVGVDVVDQLKGTAFADQFKTIEQAITFATEAGYDFTNIPMSKVIITADEIVKKIKELPAPIDEAGKRLEQLQTSADALDKIRQSSDALRNSQRALADLMKVTAQQLNDNVTKAFIGLAQAQREAAAAPDSLRTAEIGLANARIDASGAADRMLQAERGLTAARKSLTDIGTKIQELEKQRAELLADTNREAREVADAEAAVTRGRQELLDITERGQELEHERMILAREGPEEIAAADRSIERAKISLNKARRDEIELQNELNHINEVSVDLTGASVDEIKSRMAGARAQLSAQRAVNKHRKSEQEIADDLQTAALNRVDAEAAVNDAIQARTDLDYTQAVARRENAEAFQAQQLDLEASLRRQEEVQINLDKILRGDTETAATLKTLNKQIEDAIWEQEDAQITVRDRQREVEKAVTDTETAAIAVRNAQREVLTAQENVRLKQIEVRDRMRETRDATGEIKRHTEDIQIAQDKVKQDAQDYQKAVATAKGDTDAINKLLLTQIGLNQAIMAQDRGLAEQVAKDILGPLGVVKTRGGDVMNTGRINEMIDILINRPQDLAGFLRGLGLPFEKGGIVTQHTFAQIGEKGRPEVVLPLTNPGRSMTLLAQSIPLMHTALQKKIAPLVAPRTALSTSSASTAALTSALPKIMSSGGGGSKPYVRKADGPATYGQIAELIELLKKLNAKEYLHVEAPTTIETGANEDVIVRRVSRQVERKINELLRGR